MKIVFALGLLTSLAAAVLAFMVRKDIKEARLEKDNNNRQTLTWFEKIDTVGKAIDETDKSWVSTRTDTKKEADDTKILKKEIATKESELEDVKKAIAEFQTKREGMKAEIARILTDSGVTTPEEVIAKRDELKTEIDSKAKEAEVANSELEIAKKSLAEVRQMEARFKQQQAARKAAIALGGNVGRIGAVNPDFGFVVVNMGSKQGVTTDSRLIVKRGGSLIAKLKIVEIDDTQTVAEFRERDLIGGAILPGDEVIFEGGSGT